ncbi:hypothetical protein [Xanthomonas phage XAJ2]|uniref:Uncharacterized protein n=1 Tax=Xanthomonas phage XAJ2 TaxID=1775249 RepID=A0A1I9L2K0_9CAUD|nr:hypothetical protein [Xanthomonas phage XAJ2]
MAKPKTASKAVITAALSAIVAATQAGNFEYTPETVHGPLVAEGLVEVNPEMKNEAGDLATRATSKGIEQMNAQNQPATGDTTAQTTAPAASKPSFQIEVATLPPVSGRGRSAGSSLYPFEQLEVGQSFFVPATAEKPEPAKSLASVVSAANKRTGVETGETKQTRNGNTIPVIEFTKHFVVRARSAADESREGLKGGTDGARVYRIK